MAKIRSPDHLASATDVVAVATFLEYRLHPVPRRPLREGAMRFRIFDETDGARRPQQETGAEDEENGGAKRHGVRDAVRLS